MLGPHFILLSWGDSGHYLNYSTFWHVVNRPNLALIHLDWLPDCTSYIQLSAAQYGDRSHDYVTTVVALVSISVMSPAFRLRHPHPALKVNEREAKACNDGKLWELRFPLGKAAQSLSTCCALLRCGKRWQHRPKLARLQQDRSVLLQFHEIPTSGNTMAEAPITNTIRFLLLQSTYFRSSFDGACESSGPVPNPGCCKSYGSCYADCRSAYAPTQCCAGVFAWPACTSAWRKVVMHTVHAKNALIASENQAWSTGTSCFGVYLYLQLSWPVFWALLGMSGGTTAKCTGTWWT